MSWVIFLLAGTLLTAAMATGVLPIGAAGIGRVLFCVYAPLLLVATVAGLAKRK